MSTIKNQIKRYIDDNFIMDSGGPPLTDADSLLDLRIVDSTGILELILFLEESFDIQVLDAEMVPENLDSLNAIEAYVSKKQKVAA